MVIWEEDPEFLVMRRYAAVFKIIPYICDPCDVRVLVLFQVNLNFLNIQLSMMSWFSWLKLPLELRQSRFQIN